MQRERGKPHAARAQVARVMTTRLIRMVNMEIPNESLCNLRRLRVSIRTFS